MKTILKTFVRADGERRVLIYERGDGYFGFIEEMRVTTYDGDSAWSPLPGPSPICSSVEIAESEARSRIAWLQNSN